MSQPDIRLNNDSFSKSELTEINRKIALGGNRLLLNDQAATAGGARNPCILPATIRWCSK